MLIKHAYVVFEEEVKRCDLRIEEGIVVEISDSLKGEGIDASGQFLMPAMVDIGVKVRDRKLRRGRLERLSRKGALHGFGTIVLSSQSQPPIDDEITLEFVKSQAELCQDASIGSLIAGLKEDGGLSDCSILLKEGGLGIECRSDIDGNLLRRLMEYAKMHDATLFCHTNDKTLQGEGVMQEGELSARMGLAGISSLAESSQVARVGEFAKAYGVDVVILGASTPETLALCAQNDFLMAQVPLHHLLLSDKACEGYDTRGKLFPPLREEAMRVALLDALGDDADIMLTSLHSPVAISAKDAVFAEAAYGIDALPNFLPLAYSYLVKPGYITMEQLVRMITTLPAASIGSKGRRIEIGQKADLILFDPRVESVVEDLTSPYHRWQIRGKVVFIKEGTTK